MTPAKLNVFFAFFPYGGNGGCSSEHPNLRTWFADTLLKAKADERVGRVETKDFADTPIPMTRNAAVRLARQLDMDVLVMVDSDQHPDRELLEGDRYARPFWDSSFDFLYRRRLANQATVIGAPYCGPPPVENVYIFRWGTRESAHPNVDFRLEQYSREEAARMAGIHAAAALPTGLIMFDILAFDAVKPPYFYYEWTDEEQAEKASTEDVTATRDLSLAGIERLGYNPVFCNWDAWAGHWKPKCVGKPRLATADQISATFREAVLRDRKSNERLVYVRPNGDMARHLAALDRKA